MRTAAYIRSQSTENLAKMSAAQSGIKVEVTDLETKTSITYLAIRAAARALCIDKRYIEQYIYFNPAPCFARRPVLGRYIFKLHSDGGENTKVVNVERHALHPQTSLK